MEGQKVTRAKCLVCRERSAMRDVFLIAAVQQRRRVFHMQVCRTCYLVLESLIEQGTVAEQNELEGLRLGAIGWSTRV